MKKTISLKVNSTEHRGEVEARTMLLKLEGGKIPFSRLKSKVSVEAG